MATQISCPECSAKLRLAQPVAAGKGIRCPKCQHAFKVATSSAAVTPAESRPTPPPEAAPRKAPSRNGKARRPAPAPKRRKPAPNNLAIILIAAGVGGVILLGGAVVLAAWYFLGSAPTPPAPVAFAQPDADAPIDAQPVDPAAANPDPNPAPAPNPPENTKPAPTTPAVTTPAKSKPRNSDNTYDNVRLRTVSKGLVIFMQGSETYKIPVAPNFKVFDKEGNVQDPVLGVARFLRPNNILNVKTAPGRSGNEQVVEVRFVSGEVAELPGQPKADVVNLRPDPKRAGNVIDSGGYTADPYWINYIPTAQVGDFVEYTRGSDKEPGRIETVEVGRGYVVIARVWYILSSRQEQREKHRLPPPGTNLNPNSFGKKTPPRPKQFEPLVIAGRQLLCEVEGRSGSRKWRSPAVPFDGLVKEESRNGFTLTNFGRGQAKR